MDPLGRNVRTAEVRDESVPHGMEIGVETFGVLISQEVGASTTEKLMSIFGWHWRSINLVLFLRTLFVIQSLLPRTEPLEGRIEIGTV